MNAKEPSKTIKQIKARVIIINPRSMKDIWAYLEEHGWTYAEICSAVLTPFVDKGSSAVGLDITIVEEVPNPNYEQELKRWRDSPELIDAIHLVQEYGYRVI